MSIHSDNLATPELSHNDTKPTLLQGFRTLLTINDTPVTTKYAKIIRIASYNTMTTEYLQRKFHLTQKELHLIDWDALEEYMNNSTFTIQARTVRYI